MSGETNPQIGEVERAEIEKFTAGELIRHPLDTARFVAAVVPPTIDFVIGSLGKTGVQKVVKSAEGIAEALDCLKPINHDKAERIQTNIRNAIARAPKN